MGTGGTGNDGRKFPWGDEPADPERLNFYASKVGRPTPVGIYPLGQYAGRESATWRGTSGSGARMFERVYR